MAKPNLPVNVDATYGDDADPSVKIHQQHHDSIHTVVNLFDPVGTPVSGWTWAWNAAAACFQMRAPSENTGYIRVSDFGTIGPEGSGANHTAIIQAALDAAAPSASPVLLDASRVYAVENLIIPDRVILGSEGHATYRFGSVNQPAGSGTRVGTVQLRRAGAFVGNTSTAPMVTVRGNGGGLRGVTLAGQGAPGTILEMQGAESVLENVRVINSSGVGLDVQRANNTNWRKVFVDNCGSATLPAVKVWSKTGAGSMNETNTFDVYGLTIERSANVALDLAYDDDGGAIDTAQYWAEFVRIHGLHIEAPWNDGPGPNADPLVRIGNVRAVDFIAPFIYGGSSTAPIVQYARQFARSTAGGNGGIRFIGGELLGPDPGAAQTMAHAVDLVTGDAFSIIGTRILRWATTAVRAQAGFGQSLTYDRASEIQSIVRNAGNTANLPFISDLRTGTKL